MRELIKDFVEICSRTLSIKEPIYEFGSLQVPGQEGFADLRPFFHGKHYVGADIRSGPGVDVIMDLHDIGLPSNSVGTVIIMDTLEHVEYPHRALKEVHRILIPEGLVLISSVMKFPIHDYPSDFWRFTPAGFISLLQPFSQSFVDFVGDEEFPHTVIGVGLKGAKIVLDDFLSEFGKWKEKWKENGESENKKIEFLQSQLVCLENELAGLKRSVEEKEKVISDYKFQLMTVQATIGWKMLERFRKFRDVALPAQSARARTYIILRNFISDFLDRKRLIRGKKGDSKNQFNQSFSN